MARAKSSQTEKPAPKRAPKSPKSAVKSTATNTGPKLWLRVDHGGRPLLGGGKVRLMELIEEKGSIAAAGRAMNMSYRKAWLLIDDLNKSFGTPLVGAHTGGDAGGGATLTPRGREIVALYRALEETTTRANGDHLRALESFLVKSRL